jgi:hypothetical protein
MPTTVERTRLAPASMAIRLSAWAAVVLVIFQLGSMLVSVGGRAPTWSIATLVQAGIVALLAWGAFQRQVVALALLAVFGAVRVVLLLRFLLAGTAVDSAVRDRLWIEYGVTIPVALAWIVGGVIALRGARRHGGAAA